MSQWPGAVFWRGSCFIGDYAIVGASRPREGDIYSGLGLDEQLRAHNATARMGLFVINTLTGKIENWFIESDLREAVRRHCPARRKNTHGGWHRDR